jgi:serine/threonine protein kinase
VKIGPYSVLESLATGGMAEVFLARDDSDSDNNSDGHEAAPPVVVKRLFRHYAAQPTVAAMFRHEAQVLGVLAHATFPRLLAHGRDDDGVPFIAMERITGRPISEGSDDGSSTMPLAAAVALVLALLDGLAYAHARCDAAGSPLRIVHRDVTPANVLATADGRVALIDFGVATSALADGGDASPGALRGSAGYLAPEAITGDAPVDHRADLFAVGVLLYETTLGVRLFPGGALAAMHAITRGDVPPPTARVPGYPRELERVVLRALARLPGERYASASEMTAHLAAAARACGTTPTTAAISAWVRERPRAG